jgi:hypothetical protein
VDETPDWCNMDKPLRAAPKLKPPALPGDIYSADPERFCPDGGLTISRSSPTAGGVGRAGLAQHPSSPSYSGRDRPQCRPGVGACEQREPMILQLVQPRALGRKPSDEFAVPLCRNAPPRRASSRGRTSLVEELGDRSRQFARTLWKETRANKGQSPRQGPQHSTAGSQAPQNDLSPYTDGADSKAP